MVVNLYLYFWVMKVHAYFTIEAPTASKYVVKRSRFLCFAIPVVSEEEVEELLRDYRRRYHDARHICYAFRLTSDGSVSRSSDNGEPSGTAARPMMGALLSRRLTCVLLVCVRYFGGVKLGTPGLAAAYKQAAEMALDSARVVEREPQEALRLTFDYAQAHRVMSLVKVAGVKVGASHYGLTCEMTLTGSTEAIHQLRAQLVGLAVVNS